MFLNQWDLMTYLPAVKPATEQTAGASDCCKKKDIVCLFMGIHDEGKKDKITQVLSINDPK